MLHRSLAAVLVDTEDVVDDRFYFGLERLAQPTYAAQERQVSDLEGLICLALRGLVVQLGPS